MIVGRCGIECSKNVCCPDKWLSNFAALISAYSRGSDLGVQEDGFDDPMECPSLSSKIPRSHDPGHILGGWIGRGEALNEQFGNKWGGIGMVNKGIESQGDFIPGRELFVFINNPVTVGIF